MFDVYCPELALFRIVVYDEDMFGDPNFIGQATYPLTCLRQGAFLIFFFLSKLKNNDFLFFFCVLKRFSKRSIKK